MGVWRACDARARRQSTRRRGEVNLEMRGTESLSFAAVAKGYFSSAAPSPSATPAACCAYRKEARIPGAKASRE